MSDREALVMPSFDDMDDFSPRVSKDATGKGHPPSQKVRSKAVDARRAIDAISHFPSREASSDGQLNLKGPQHVLDRFKAMCKSDRRSYYDMLEILMDQYERVDKFEQS